MMQELIQDYDDMYTGLTSQVLKNIFIRFYTMEQYFQFDQLQPQALTKSQSSPTQNQPSSQKSAMQNQNPTQQEPTKSMVTIPPAAQPHKKPTPILLLYNRIIQESINDLYIMNKLIYSKAKVVNALLENGKSIAAKKKQSWDKFICTSGFEQIKAAFELLCDYRKQIVIFSVLSISNLLLKLSINMSKVSVIPIQRFLNFQCLSIPTLSVAFLQNMQYRLFESKKISEDQGKTQFMRQLPKITYIKLSKYKSNTDLKILDTSQREFISSQIPIDQTVKNLQYIQIHEQQLDPILPGFIRNQQIYPHFYAFGLKEMSKGTVKAPFKFQILEFMRQVIFPLVKDFKPDEIIYMENYPNDIQVMDDQIRALMICQLAQQTCCNKMYVFKELGPTKLCIPAYENAIKESGQKINQQFVNFFADEQRKIANSYNAKKNALFQEQIKKIKKIFMNQLCYTSLALIQKTSFDSVRHQSYQNFYPIQFLQGITKTQSELLHNPVLKIEAFKTKMEGVEMMIEVHKFHQQKSQNNNVGLGIINLSLKQTCFKSFYNLNSSKQQELFSVNQNGQKQLFYYSEQDNMIVKYEQKRVVVIIIRYNSQHDYVQMVVLSLQNQQSVMQTQAKIILDPNENYLQGATYVCSNNYLYRGFGRFKKINANQNNYNKCIQRIKISPQVSKFWEPVAEQAMATKPGQKQQPKVPLQRKVHGYGLFDPESKAIIMMGGYMDSYNEEKICKNIYHIKFPDGSQIGKGQKSQKQMPQIVNVRVLGKTNKIVYTPSNQKIRQIFLYPFVYGIPFIFGSTGVVSNPPPAKGAFVLNTNGYYLNLNHNNKIFMSVMKFSNIIMYNGINLQTKLKLDTSLNDASTAIFLAEVLIKCAVFFPHQINIKGNRCCINTLEEGNIILEANLGEKKLIVQAPQIFEDDIRRQLNFK